MWQAQSLIEFLFQMYFSNNWETLECTSVERNWALQNPQAFSTTKLTCEIPKRGYGNEWYVLTMYVDSLKVNHAQKTIYFKVILYLVFYSVRVCDYLMRVLIWKHSTLFWKNGEYKKNWAENETGSNFKLTHILYRIHWKTNVLIVSFFLMDVFLFPPRLRFRGTVSK